MGTAQVVVQQLHPGDAAAATRIERLETLLAWTVGPCLPEQQAMPVRAERVCP